VKPRKPRTFAGWCQTDAPTRLGLSEEDVARVRRLMSRPEMHGVTSMQALLVTLQPLRALYPDDLSWQRFTLAARYLWLRYKNKAP
jgi:hypothetical protein